MRNKMPNPEWLAARVAEEERARATLPHSLLARCPVCTGYGLCNVCTGESPSWDGHDRNPPCVISRHAVRSEL